MSTVKISDLSLIQQLDANTSNTLFVAVDIPSGVTGKFTGTTLAQGLYSHNPLNVGNNHIIAASAIGQFGGNNASYLQVNLQNFTSSGSGDYIVTADDGTDTTNYIDLGINGSTFSDSNYSSMYPNDGYLYVNGDAVSTSHGNLVIGTASSDTKTVLIAGGTKNSNIVGYITKTGLTLNTGRYFTFDDGTTQSSAAATYDYVNANVAYIAGVDATQNTRLGKAEANTVYLFGALNQTNTNIVSANTQLKAYTDGNFVANTATIQLKNLNLSGNLTANTVGTTVSIDNFVSKHATFSQDVNVLGILTCNTALGNVFFSNITTVTSQANTIQWFSQSAEPSQTFGQVWYSANDAALVIDTDITGDRPLLGKTIYERVYNATGATITGGSWVRLAGAVTSNSIPYIVLADATNYANSVVAGFVKNNIANGTYGFIYTTGIVNRLNMSGFNNGDVIFLSTTPGGASNVAPSGANVPVQIAKVLSNDAILGKLQVGILPQPAWGRTSGSFVYASNNNLVTSNTITISDALKTLTMRGNVNVLDTNGNNTFSVTGTGRVQVTVPNIGINDPGALLINASTDGSSQPVNQAGGMLHMVGPDGYVGTVGQTGSPARLTIESYGTSALSSPFINARRSRGTAASPTAVQSGDSLFRLAASGWATTNYNDSIANSFPAIEMVATQTFAANSFGAITNLYNVANNSNVRVLSASFTSNGISIPTPNTGITFQDNTYQNTAFTNNISVSSVIANNTIQLKYLPSSNGMLYLDGANTVLESTYFILDTPNTAVNISANAINCAQNTALFIANTIHYNASYNNTTVTQLTNKSTAVYANGRSGQITTNGANINKGAAVSFTVYNNYITSAKDVVILSISSGATVAYATCVNAVSPGSFVVSINNSDGTPSGANAADTLVINFAIINVT